jgi:hypothetical protein
MNVVNDYAHVIDPTDRFVVVDTETVPFKVPTWTDDIADLVDTTHDNSFDGLTAYSVPETIREMVTVRAEPYKTVFKQYRSMLRLILRPINFLGYYYNNSLFLSDDVATADMMAKLFLHEAGHRFSIHTFGNSTMTPGLFDASERYSPASLEARLRVNSGQLNLPEILRNGVGDSENVDTIGQRLLDVGNSLFRAGYYDEAAIVFTNGLIGSSEPSYKTELHLSVSYMERLRRCQPDKFKYWRGPTGQSR